MRLRHGSPTATSAAPFAPNVTPATPNAGAFRTRPWPPATADVLIADTGWRGTRITDHTAHRPHADDPTQPACAATTTGKWWREAAGHARTMLASPCRERCCYPGGWDW